MSYTFHGEKEKERKGGEGGQSGERKRRDGAGEERR